MGSAARDLVQQQRDRQAADRPAAQCRICAADISTDDDGMHIFAEDGRRHYLQTKIRKYLHILVSEGPRARFLARVRTFFARRASFFSLALPLFSFKIRPPLPPRTRAGRARISGRLAGISKRAPHLRRAPISADLRGSARDPAACRSSTRNEPRRSTVRSRPAIIPPRNRRRTIPGSRRSSLRSPPTPLRPPPPRRATTSPSGNKSTRASKYNGDIFADERGDGAEGRAPLAERSPPAEKN